VIQAEGANPLVRSFGANDGGSLGAGAGHTRATAIRIGNPASWRKAARVIQETGGWCLDVSEGGNCRRQGGAGPRRGIGCEPASAVTLAGLKKLVAPRARSLHPTRWCCC
jgi:threonine synthase